MEARGLNERLIYTPVVERKEATRRPFALRRVKETYLFIGNGTVLDEAKVHLLGWKNTEQVRRWPFGRG
jgi:hypothetical protein